MRRTKNIPHAFAAVTKALFIAAVCGIPILQIRADAGVMPRSMAPPPNPGSAVFDEQFNDNHNVWQVGNTNFSWVSIQGGKLYLAGRNPQGGYTIINYRPQLKGANAFTIETSLTKLKGRDTALFGLVWGAADLSNFYFFGLTNQGQMLAERMQAGRFLGGSPMPVIFINRGRGAANTLKVIYRNHYAYYLINGNMMGRLPLPAPIFNGTGFLVLGQNYISADYLRITKGLSERDEGLCKELDAGCSNAANPPRFKLGVEIQTMDADLMRRSGMTTQEGVYVVSVAPNSPAQKSGIVPGDVILSANGVRLYTSVGAVSIITQNPKAELTMWRHGKTVMLKTDLAPASAAAEAENAPEKVIISFPVVISAVQVSPAKVKPGGTFDLKVTYTAHDPGTSGNATVMLIYSIVKNKKTVFEKTVQFSALNGKETSSVNHGLIACRERGTYDVRVTVRCAGKSSNAATRLIVE